MWGKQERQTLNTHYSSFVSPKYFWRMYFFFYSLNTIIHKRAIFKESRHKNDIKMWIQSKDLPVV